MRKALLALVVAIVLLSAALSVFAAAGPYDRYLSVVDVQRLTGLQGVKQVPRDPSKGAGGDLNFAVGNDRLILMVLFSGVSNYEPSKAQKGYFKSAVAGVGEAAFCGPAADPQYILVFKKKTYCVSVSTYFNFGAKPPTMLTMDQLIAIAKLVASRI